MRSTFPRSIADHRRLADAARWQPRRCWCLAALALAAPGARDLRWRPSPMPARPASSS